MVALLLVASLAHSAVVGAKAPKKPKPAPPTPPPVSLEMPPPPTLRPPKKSELRLAAPGLSGVNVPAAVTGFYNEHLAQQMSGWGARVVTAKEIQSLLGFERQKQLLGCGDQSSSCLAELGNALGVDGLVIGDVARIGNAFQLNLKVVAVEDAKLLAGFSAKVDEEGQLLAAFNHAGRVLTQSTAEKLRVTLPEPSAEFLSSGGGNAEVVRLYEQPYRQSAWIPAASGVVAGGIGAGLLLYSEALVKDLSRTSGAVIDRDRGLQMYEDAKRSRTLGWVGVGIGAAGLAASGLMFLYSRERPPDVSAVIVPNGGGLSLVGVFP